MPPKHAEYAVAMLLCTAATTAEIAEARGLTLEKAEALIRTPGVVEAQKKLMHLHRVGPAAARGVLLDQLPDVLKCLLAVATDVEHKQWAFATKLYLDRVMPTVEQAHTHHTHEVDTESKEAIRVAGESLSRLVEGLMPQLAGFTGLRAKAQDIRKSPRILRGVDAKPAPLVLEVEAVKETDE